MVQNLSQYLAEHTCQGFKPVPHYFPDGDFVSYFFRPDRCYAERVDDMLTVYLAFDSNELVGCKIKGVQQVLKTAGEFGVGVADGDVRLGFFFFLGSAMAQSDAQRQRYDELGRIAKDATLDRNELQPA